MQSEQLYLRDRCTVDLEGTEAATNAPVAKVHTSDQRPLYSPAASRASLPYPSHLSLVSFVSLVSQHSFAVTLSSVVHAYTATTIQHSKVSRDSRVLARRACLRATPALQGACRGFLLRVRYEATRVVMYELEAQLEGYSDEGASRASAARLSTDKGEGDERQGQRVHVCSDTEMDCAPGLQ